MKNDKRFKIIVIAIALILLLGYFFYNSYYKKSNPSSHNTSVSKTTNNPTTGSTSTETSPTNVSDKLNSNIKIVHTDKIVVDDMHLKPNQCTLRVSDTNGKIYVLTEENKKLPVVKDLMDKGYYLPDPNCTPGGVDTAYNTGDKQLVQKICASGFSTTIRPPASATNKLKTELLDAYGIKYDKTIELDHLISLAGLWGSSTSSNLWPEVNKEDAKGTTNPKDSVETNIRTAICANKVDLNKARNAIAVNWVTAEKVLGLPSSLNGKDENPDDDDNG